MPAYQVFNSTELLGTMAMEKMLAGISTRWYPIAVEPVGEQASSTSKSAISRKFVAMTETALVDLLAVDVSDLDLVALMIDGVGFADQLCVVARGNRYRRNDASARRGGGIDGENHPRQEPAGRAARTGTGQQHADPRGPQRRHGAQGAVEEVFDQPVIARCQIHKLRHVRDHLPEKMHGPVTTRIRAAYHADSAREAEALLESLAKELDKTHPSAAGSLREGIHETLTVLRLDVPPTRTRTLRSTNAIESMISISRDHARNVKRWRDGQMALRWCAAGLVEASKQFHRVNSHLHLPTLWTSLEQHVAARSIRADCNTQTVSAA